MILFETCKDRCQVRRCHRDNECLVRIKSGQKRPLSSIWRPRRPISMVNWKPVNFLRLPRILHVILSKDNSTNKTKRSTCSKIISALRSGNYFVKTVKGSHHAEGLVNPRVHAKKRLLILDTPEHVESENIKFKIGHRSFAYQLFKKRDLYFIKCGINWQKLTKNGILRFFLKNIIFRM
jgi:hypothetical protein